jgi:hypothetical protein
LTGIEGAQKGLAIAPLPNPPHFRRAAVIGADSVIALETRYAASPAKLAIRYSSTHASEHHVRRRPSRFLPRQTQKPFGSSD